MIEVKACTKCDKSFRLSAFSCTKRAEDGSCKYYHSQCNKCRTLVSDKPKKTPKLFLYAKECLVCGKIKKLREFYKSKKGRLGRAYCCKDCFKPATRVNAAAASRKYREDNELYKANHRIYQFNRRSHQKATEDGTVTREFLAGVYATETCYWCQEYVEYKSRTLEHVKELCSGGEHSASNIEMACRSCNSSRRNREI
jgi:hypothetical protein